MALACTSAWALRLACRVGEAVGCADVSNGINVARRRRQVVTHLQCDCKSRLGVLQFGKARLCKRDCKYGTTLLHTCSMFIGGVITILCSPQHQFEPLQLTSESLREQGLVHFGLDEGCGHFPTTLGRHFPLGSKQWRKFTMMPCWGWKVMPAASKPKPPTLGSLPAQQHTKAPYNQVRSTMQVPMICSAKLTYPSASDCRIPTWQRNHNLADNLC